MLVSISTTFFYNTGQESQKSVYINKQANNKMFYVLVDVINATNASMSKNLINYVMYLPMLYNNNTVSIYYCGCDTYVCSYPRMLKIYISF